MKSLECVVCNQPQVNWVWKCNRQKHWRFDDNVNERQTDRQTKKLDGEGHDASVLRKLFEHLAGSASAWIVLLRKLSLQLNTRDRHCCLSVTVSESPFLKSKFLCPISLPWSYIYWKCWNVSSSKQIIQCYYPVLPFLGTHNLCPTILVYDIFHSMNKKCKF